MSNGGSGGGSTLASANAASSNTGNTRGSASQGCKKDAKIDVTVVSVTPNVKPTEQIRVRIEGPTSSTRFRAEKAVAAFTNLAAGDYKVSATVKGWMLVAEKPVTLAEGGKEEVKLEIKRVKLDRVEPKPPTSPTKWYINHAADISNQCGRDVEITAVLSEEVAGVKVYFSLDAKGTNNTTLSPAGLKAKLSAAEGTTNDKGKAKVTLTLSQYGGDCFRVNANLEPNKQPTDSTSEQTQWLEVWRKVFCEVDNMKRPGGASTYANNGPFADLVAEYKKHKVELVATGADSEPAHERVLHELALGPKCLAFKSGTDTPAIHVVLVDTIIWDPEDQPQEFRAAKLEGIKKFPSALTTLDVTQWRKAGSDVEVKITKTGAGAPAWQTLPSPDTHLQMTWKDDNFELKFDLKGVLGLPATGDALPADVTKLELKMILKRYIEGSGAKQGDSSIAAMRYRERKYSGADVKKHTLKTMTHETGHAMGMASKYASDGTTPATYYVRYGSHCNNDSKKCVMYGYASLHPAYCDVCSDGLRGRKLDTLPTDGGNAL